MRFRAVRSLYAWSAKSRKTGGPESGSRLVAVLNASRVKTIATDLKVRCGSCTSGLLSKWLFYKKRMWDRNCLVFSGTGGKARENGF